MARVALVTGGQRGIGAAISEALQASGRKVVASYAGNDQAAEAFTRRTGIPCYKFDVADYESCATALKQIEMEVGPVEVLVNNAGITRDGLAMRMSDEDWNAVISTNLTGTHNFCKAAIRYLRKSNGAIVNISSISGLVGNVGQTNYCAAKGGVIAYTKAMAAEYPGVRCTAICPGFIKTDMTARMPSDVLKFVVARTKTKRAGEPWEIGQAVVRAAAAYGTSYSPCSVVLVAGGMELGGG